MEIPADYAQANLKFTGSAAPTGAEITLGLNVELFAGDPADAAAEIGVAWGSSGMPGAQSHHIILSSILVKFGPNSTGPSAEIPVSHAGTQTSDAPGPAVALLVRKTTGFGGRTGRGRFYIPAPPENAIDSAGFLTGGFHAARLAELSDFYDKLVIEGLVPSLLHGPDSPVSAPMLITDLVLDTKVATQRRRLRR